MRLEPASVHLEDAGHAALKPGVRMPSYARLPDEDAQTLLDYLEALQ